MKIYKFQLQSKAGLIDEIEICHALTRKEAKHRASKIMFSDLLQRFPKAEIKRFYII